MEIGQIMLHLILINERLYCFIERVILIIWKAYYFTDLNGKINRVIKF